MVERTGFPDWTRAIVLLGWDGDNFIPILLDDLGNLNVYMQGEEAPGVMHMIRVDDDGRMITKLRGRDGNYLVVDDEGFMTTVIKGQGLLGLETVTVDAAGRLNAFVYDTVDAWGQTASVGFAELAARMGSMVRYERSGQVLFMDGFEYGLQHWDPAPGGTDAEVVLDPRYCQSSGYSCFLKSGKTDPWNAMIRHRQGGLPTGKMGYQVSFSQGSVGDTFACEMYLWDGVERHDVFMRWSDTLMKLQVYERDTGWTTIDGPLLAFRGAWCFNTMKIVADLDTNKYVRVRLNNYTIDLSDWDVKVTADPTEAGMDFFITNTGNNLQNDYVWVDDVVITFAET